MTHQYPKTLINIHLPSEPLTRQRSYCLRQLSKDQWCTCYYGEDDDEFYYGHYFVNLEAASTAVPEAASTAVPEAAYVEFRTELNRQMKRYDYYVRMFFKYRAYIISQEIKS